MRRYFRFSYDVHPDVSRPRRSHAERETLTEDIGPYHREKTNRESCVCQQPIRHKPKALRFCRA